jgi:hypothetical protein
MAFSLYRRLLFTYSLKPKTELTALLPIYLQRNYIKMGAKKGELINKMNSGVLISDGLTLLEE